MSSYGCTVRKIVSSSDSSRIVHGHFDIDDLITIALSNSELNRFSRRRWKLNNEVVTIVVRSCNSRIGIVGVDA